MSVSDFALKRIDLICRSFENQSKGWIVWCEMPNEEGGIFHAMKGGVEHVFHLNMVKYTARSFKMNDDVKLEDYSIHNLIKKFEDWHE